MTNKILTTYKYVSDKNLLATVHRVLGKMEGNNNFPNPPAALATIKQELPGFIIALTEASGGDMEKTAIKNAKKAAMIGLLAQLTEYINSVSNNDRAMLLSSGFPVTRDKGDTSLGDIKGLEIIADRPGEAITRIKRVVGARAYLHQCVIGPVNANSVWTSRFVAEPVYTFNGLQSQERYVFKVIAVGKKGQEASSPEVARVIQ